MTHNLWVILNELKTKNYIEMLQFKTACINLAEHWGDSITETVEAFDELQLWDRAY